MRSKYDSLYEIDQATLAKIALVAAAGIGAAAGGKHLYKKYKEKKLLKRFGEESQEDLQKHSIRRTAEENLPDANDILWMSRQMADTKK
jgi:hypothetical protein